jgi:hypothetical protein
MTLRKLYAKWLISESGINFTTLQRFKTTACAPTTFSEHFEARKSILSSRESRGFYSPRACVSSERTVSFRP